jgi:hypothetical protein
MRVRKFAVGQVVDVRTNLFGVSPPGPFEITSFLPPTGLTHQYRVKSLSNGHERVVREDEVLRNNS